MLLLKERNIITKLSYCALNFECHLKIVICKIFPHIYVEHVCTLY